jgi:hypothetical protein
MPAKASKRPRKPKDEDVNEMAYRLVHAITGEEPDRKKNPIAVAFGRLGASKGGQARAKKLSAAKRKAIARKAARVRWRKRPAKP